MKLDYVLPGLLAGSSRPGLLDPLEADMAQICRFGFRLVVNLTDEKQVPGPENWGLESASFSIPDMGVPPYPANLLPLVREIDEYLERREPVLVHCRAGLGRTGMVLACQLVFRGASANAAIAQVRARNHHFIQNLFQERFVEEFAKICPPVSAAAPR